MKDVRTSPGPGFPECPDVRVAVFPEALYVLTGTVVAEASSIFFLCSYAEVRQQATQGHALAHDPEAEISMVADSSLCLYQGVILECLLPLFLPFCVHTPTCPLAVTLCHLLQLLRDNVHLPTHGQLLEIRMERLSFRGFPLLCSPLLLTRESFRSAQPHWNTET